MGYDLQVLILNFKAEFANLLNVLPNFKPFPELLTNNSGAQNFQLRYSQMQQMQRLSQIQYFQHFEIGQFQAKSETLLPEEEALKVLCKHWKHFHQGKL